MWFRQSWTRRKSVQDLCCKLSKNWYWFSILVREGSVVKSCNNIRFIWRPWAGNSFPNGRPSTSRQVAGALGSCRAGARPNSRPRYAIRRPDRSARLNRPVGRATRGASFSKHHCAIALWTPWGLPQHGLKGVESFHSSVPDTTNGPDQLHPCHKRHSCPTRWPYYWVALVPHARGQCPSGSFRKSGPGHIQGRVSHNVNRHRVAWINPLVGPLRPASAQGRRRGSEFCDPGGSTGWSYLWSLHRPCFGLPVRCVVLETVPLLTNYSMPFPSCIFNVGITTP